MTPVLQLLILLCWSRMCLAEDVIQKPIFHPARPKDNVSLTCTDGRSNYNTKYWYKLQNGKGLVLIGFSVYEQITIEDGFNDGRMKIQPNGTIISHLNISNVSAQDSAVYYCASSLAGDRGAADRQYFGHGTTLFVLEEGKNQKKPDVSIYRPKKRELEDNNFISLVCVASNFFPEHVKIRWFVNSEERINLYEPVPQKNADDSYSTSKRLTLTREEYFNPDTTFRCVAAFLDGTLEASEEIKGETDCGVSKEFYTMYINQGKISYIMVLCKSGLYALVVLVLVWRKKVIAHSY